LKDKVAALPGSTRGIGEAIIRRLDGNGRAYLAERNERTSFGRIETAEEIAVGVAHLSSDEAAHVTG
jgi:NAD(P)-dependent dehydrogenase (short-subunit alcohol dehydrogenase family)